MVGKEEIPETTNVSRIAYCIAQRKMHNVTMVSCPGRLKEPGTLAAVDRRRPISRG